MKPASPYSRVSALVAIVSCATMLVATLAFNVPIPQWIAILAITLLLIDLIGWTAGQYLIDQRAKQARQIRDQQRKARLN